MLNNCITLEQLIKTAQECDGKIVIADPTYGETHEVTYFDTAHNLEMFFACIDDVDSPDISIDDVIYSPETLEEISYYGVYAYIDENSDFRDALPVTDCAMDNGTLVLFV